VRLAAVVVIPEKELPLIHASSFHALGASESLYSSRMPILGNDLLQSWSQLIRKLGMKSLWLTSAFRQGTASFSALAELAGRGFERLLMITLKSYAEMDLADLLRFHCEKRNSVTEAHDARGQLGVCLLDHLALAQMKEESESPEARNGHGQIPYSFSGYAKRILSTKERQELVADGLTGACAMRPVGTEVRENVWIGPNVSLADSARVVAPAYIGRGTVVRAGSTIGPFASVEHDCVVDCGTTVERSSVLPHTYLAPGLLIRNALVDGGYLEHLGLGIVADLEPAGLASKIKPLRKRAQMFHDSDSDTVFPAGNVEAWHVSGQITSNEWREVYL
jgi:carbonic anhydrase/acetyltransferase-like protein (isoleucine patch superfamily)